MSVTLETIQSNDSVGQHTAHAEINSQLAAAYADATNNSLRYATRTAVDNWVAEFVDGTDTGSNQEIVSSQTDSGTYAFGFAVSDLWVAVQFIEPGNSPSTGIALYKNVSGTWTFSKKILASSHGLTGTNASAFGRSLAFTQVNGEYTLVAGGNNRVFVFFQGEGGSDNWGTVQSGSPAEAVGESSFGAAVAVSRDNLVVGSEDSNRADTEGGAAYGIRGTITGNRIVYDFSVVEVMTGTNSVAFGKFGSDLSISGDFLAIGAPGEGTGGSVYIFEDQAVGGWTEITDVTGSTTVANEGLGNSVSLSGTFLVAGITSDARKAFLFEKDTGGADTWGEVKVIVPADAASITSKRFGIDVAILGDKIIVGASDADGDFSKVGKVYSFSRNRGGSNNWGESGTFKVEDAAAQDQFGSAVGINSDSIFGFTNEHDHGGDIGAIYVFSSSSGSSVGTYASLTDFDSKPAISYYDATNSSLKVAIKNAGVWRLETVDVSGDVGQHTSIAVINGNLAVAYYDVTNTSLKYAEFDSGLDTWLLTEVDNTADVGQYASLIEVDGEPGIAYYDATSGNLKYAQLDNGTNIWDIVTVDSTNDVGLYASLAVVNGEPAIAYFDETNNRLLYAEFDGASWTGGEVVHDPADDVGRYCSLSNVNGDPYIAYQNTTMGELLRAFRDGGGTWSTFVLDDGSHVSVGQFTSSVVVDNVVSTTYYDATNFDALFVEEDFLITVNDVSITVEGELAVGLFSVDSIINVNDVDITVGGELKIDGFFGVPIQTDEYESIHVGKWYYSQAKPGTPWFDRVNNSKGWTVQFNLEMMIQSIGVQNSNTFSDGSAPEGLGVYVNDGVRQEVIYFFEQELGFRYAGQSVVFDTTQETDYRIASKGDRLRLYARKADEFKFTLIADITLSKPSSNEGNGYKPAIAEDGDGNLHSVWHDDGNGLGQIYYAKYVDGVWSVPEVLASNKFGVQNPDIATGSDGKIYVVYETKETDFTSISFIYRNEIGWSSPELIGVGIGDSKRPKVDVDTTNAVHVVWEDHRFDQGDIFYRLWNANTLSWGQEKRLTESLVGAFRPSVCTYRERAYIAWTLEESSGNSRIQSRYYNSLNKMWFDDVDVTDGTNGEADFSSISIDTAGRVYIVWHDDQTGDFEIYARIFNPNLHEITSVTQVTSSASTDRKFPVTGFDTNAGEVFIVWEDNRDARPMIYTARYKTATGSWLSSGQSGTDTQIDALDERSSLSPAIAKNFTGDLHILHEVQFARDEDEYLLSGEIFQQIRDGVFDKSVDPIFALLDDAYIERDVLVNGLFGRKEIRFGDFSNTLSAKMRFKNFKYYLEDCVEPFEIIPISGEAYGTEALRVNDVFVNDSCNAWVGTLCGIRFYFDVNKGLATVGDSSLKIRAMAFSNNNTLFVAGKDENDGDFVSYSLDHANLLSITLPDLGEVTSMVFDRNNRLFVGTTDKGMLIYKITLTDAGSLEAVLDEDVNTELPSLFVSSLSIDGNNAVWIGTRSGLSRYLNGKVLNFTTAEGLPSNRINDVAIRNSAIRYVATSSGIARMVGTQFEALTSDDGFVAANNVKSIAWQEPNILWAGTLSKLNQILVRDDGTTTSVSYGPDYYSLSNGSFDDRRTFFIITEDDDDVRDDALVEVYLNGNRISHGFEVSITNSKARVLRFETELIESDVVDVIIRNDVTLLASFGQSSEEKKELGKNTIRVKELATDGANVYLLTDGDENELKVNDGNSQLPADRVHLDVNPPKGCIQIAETITNTTVRVNVVGETEGTLATDGDGGSGIDTMVVSNFSNFTSDGTTPQTPVPFVNTLIHDVGLAFSAGSTGDTTVTSTLEFSTGSGTSIRHFSSENETYVAKSQPAVLYLLDNATGDWNEVLSFGATDYIDFIERFNGRFIVSVGSDTAAAKIYSYADDGLFASPTIRATSGSRAFVAEELNGLLYIGSGDDGKLYSFDGETLTIVTDGISSNIYDLAAEGAELFAATGDAGLVWRITPDATDASDVAMISHSDSDTAITAIQTYEFNNKTLVFAGTSSEGKILRSEVLNASFNKSFQTVSSSVNVLRVVNDILYATVGDTIYIFDVNGAWTWRYSHDETINDLDVSANGILFIVSDSKALRIGTGTTEDETETQLATVYLKLIDKAGNETVVSNDDGELVECFFDSVSISDLVNNGSSAFFNENKILELDELGNVIDTINGTERFFSADDVPQECGEYISETFNGTNDIIKWDTISWTATQPASTTVEMFIRVSASETDILAEEWIGPFSVSQSGGVDISAYTGQFLQFRALLKSTIKDLSPSLSNVVVRNVTGEAIHFFTTNFVLPSRVKKGIITSQSLIPVSADVVFGINTTNSVNFSDYQIVDQNRLFNVDQTGENLRVGIKLISPSRSSLIASEFDEYGPYSSNLFVNTIDFTFTNTGPTANYDFRVTFYEDVGLTTQVFQAFSSTDQENWSIDGEDFPAGGSSVTNSQTVRTLFTVPGSAGLNCNTFYFVKIESFDGIGYTTLVDDFSYIAGCSASFIDIIDFDFTNYTGLTNDYHFRVRFFEDGERTDLFLTEFSGNDRNGWTADAMQVPEGGIEITPNETVSMVFEPDQDQFELNTLYYLTIDAFDGSGFLLESNFYTFQISDVVSSIYCGPYIDVPVVKNFALMFELLNNEFITLNLQ